MAFGLPYVTLPAAINFARHGKIPTRPKHRLLQPPVRFCRAKTSFLQSPERFRPFKHSFHQIAGLPFPPKADYPSGDGLQETTIGLERHPPNEVEKLGDVATRHFSRLENTFSKGTSIGSIPTAA